MTAFGAVIPIIVFTETDFPLPDSPTMATVSPGYTSIFTPRTARILPKEA